MANPLALPTRVSRVYPVLVLILLMTSGSFLYEWQKARIALGDIPQIQARNAELTAQVRDLAKTNSADQVALKEKQKRIDDTAAQLASLQSQLKDLSSQLQSQKDQLSANASELAKLRTQPPLFSFQNQSNIADVGQKEADVKQLVTDAYGYIKDLYGTPYLLSKVTITFVDGFSISGSAGEIVITNGSSGISMDIHLKGFDKASFQDINTVVHEMIHAFHGVAVFTSSALEEGMTVAAADAVMKRMEADGKIPQFDHLYLSTSDDQYAQWNSELTVPSDNDAFYSSSHVSELYQLIGTAWYRLYEADPAVFKKINDYYYPLVQKGQTPTAAMARAAIKASLTTINGEPIATYVAANRAFNPS